MDFPKGRNLFFTVTTETKRRFFVIRKEDIPEESNKMYNDRILDQIFFVKSFGEKMKTEAAVLRAYLLLDDTPHTVAFVCTEDQFKSVNPLGDDACFSVNV